MRRQAISNYLRSITACVLLCSVACAGETEPFQADQANTGALFTTSANTETHMNLNLANTDLAPYETGSDDKNELSIPVPPARVSVHSDDLGQVESLELSGGFLKGIFESVRLDEQSGHYRVNGVGWLNADSLLSAASEASGDALFLCDSVENEQNWIPTQLNLEIRFENIENSDSEEAHLATQVSITYRGASLHTQELCGNNAEQSNTEIQIELEGALAAEQELN